MVQGCIFLGGVFCGEIYTPAVVLFSCLFLVPSGDIDHLADDPPPLGPCWGKCWPDQEGACFMFFVKKAQPHMHQHICRCQGWLFLVVMTGLRESRKRYISRGWMGPIRWLINWMNPAGGWGRRDQGGWTEHPMLVHTVPHLRTYLLLCHPGNHVFPFVFGATAILLVYGGPPIIASEVQMQWWAGLHEPIIASEHAVYLIGWG